MLRLQMIYAVISVKDQGFLEQRITSGATGLELVTWQRLVVGGVVTKSEYNRMVAHIRLRSVLMEARIPVGIQPDLQPGIAQFAAENHAQEITMDGAHVVTQIRNRLVHPDGRQERIYQQNRLLTEVWLLTQHYLVLLILHSLGYQGLYCDLRRLEGWPECTNVPWANRPRI